MKGVRVRRPGVFFLLLTVAVAGVGSAAALFLAGEVRGAGLALAPAGAALIVTSGSADVSPRLVLLQAVTERALEAAVFGVIAWTALPEDAPIAVAAMVALGVSYLATYFRVRSLGLGFRVTETGMGQGTFLLLVAAGLFADLVAFTLWVVAALSAVTLAYDVAVLTRQREPE
jgi:hypothetical protein